MQPFGVVFVPSCHGQIEIAITVVVGPTGITEIDTQQATGLRYVLDEEAIVVAEHAGNTLANAIPVGGFADQDQVGITVAIVVAPGGLASEHSRQAEA